MGVGHDHGAGDVDDPPPPPALRERPPERVRRCDREEAEERVVARLLAEDDVVEREREEQRRGEPRGAAVEQAEEREGRAHRGRPEDRREEPDCGLRGAEERRPALEKQIVEGRMARPPLPEEDRRDRPVGVVKARDLVEPEPVVVDPLEAEGERDREDAEEERIDLPQHAPIVAHGAGRGEGSIRGRDEMVHERAPDVAPAGPEELRPHAPRPWLAEAVVRPVVEP
jgi:hypothetical protein